MAYTSLPILFYNLGGEMLYVLDQRLDAQKIPEDKAKKVMYDIVDAMFNIDTFKSVIKCQPLFPSNAMKVIFTRIVHSSIMKVNSDSMEKLFDLMLMSVKYQFLQCSIPLELMHITLNHLDAIFSQVASEPQLVEKVKYIYNELVSMYQSITTGEFLLLKQSLLNFLQDSHSKVSVYLSFQKQNEHGRFVIPRHGEVPPGYDVPGTITLYKKDESGKVQATTKEFESGCRLQENVKSHSQGSVSNEINGFRCTNLGKNIYKELLPYDFGTESNEQQQQLSPEQEQSSQHKQLNLQEEEQPTTTALSTENKDSSRYAQAELGILAHMIGGKDEHLNDEKAFEFKLSMLSTDMSQFRTSNIAGNSSTKDGSSKNVVKIIPEKSGKEELTQVIADLTVSSSNKNSSYGEDLLSLMDS